MNVVKLSQSVPISLFLFLLAANAAAAPYRITDTDRTRILERAPITMLRPGVTAEPSRLQALRNALTRRSDRMHRAARRMIPNAAALITWTAAGPDNIGGRINTILVNPANPQQLFIGASSGGIWKSADGGQHWVSVGDFLASLAVSALARLPDGTLLAGTGDQFNKPRRGIGVLASTDNGATWTPLASTDPADNRDWYYVNDFAVNPDGVILAATGVTPVSADWGGIYRSDDGGQTFTEVQSGVSLDVVFDPNDPDNAVAEFENGTVRYSADAGLTWSAPVSIVVGGGRIALAYAASESGWLYAVVDDDTAGGVADLDREFEDVEGLSPENRPDYDKAWQQELERWLDIVEDVPRPDTTGVSGSLYRSQDGGQTWSRRGAPAVGLLCSGSVGEGYCQGWYDNVVWADPTDADRVVAGGIDLFRTKDGGSSWTKISNWTLTPDSPHADHHALAAASNYDGVANKTFFNGDDGGMYSTDDIGAVQVSNGWKERNTGLAVTEFYAVAGHAGDTAADNGGIVPIVGGAQDNGTLLRDANDTKSSSWVTIFGGDGGYVDVDPGDADYLYGEYVYLDIFQSTSGGPGAQELFPLPPDSNDSSRANFIAPLLLDPSNANAMFAGGRSLWYGAGLKHGQLSWRSLNGDSLPTSSLVYSIAVNGGNHNDAWVGLNDGGIYRSTNALAGSPQWQQVGADALPVALPTDIYLLPGTPTTIYIAYDERTGDALWMSTDGGGDWTDIGGGLPDVPVYAVTTDPGNDRMIFAGTETGLYVSTDGGASWSTNDQGPANVAVTQLHWFDPVNHVLLLGSYGRGAFLGQINEGPTNPQPTITGLVPSSASAGSAGLSLQIDGTGFISSSVAQWNGDALATTWVSGTELDADVPADDLANTGTVPVTVETPPPGGGVSNAATFTIGNPTPAIDAIAPQSVTVGSDGFTLVVSGAGLVSTSVVQWNGDALATTYVSATELDATVPASDVAVAGTAEVNVKTPQPGGGVSNSVSFTISSTNPVPGIASLAPPGAVAGGDAFTLDVGGTGFVASSAVQWNGDALATTYVSDTELHADVPAAAIANAGSAAITVSTPAPGGGVSNSVTFEIANPAPVLASISPTQATAGSEGLTLTVNGSGFVADSVVQWGGHALATGYVSGTSLSAAVPAGDLATAGSFQVKVVNLAPGGGTSGAIAFTVEKSGGGGGGSGGGAFSLPLLALLLAALLLMRRKTFGRSRSEGRG